MSCGEGSFDDTGNEAIVLSLTEVLKLRGYKHSNQFYVPPGQVRPSSSPQTQLMIPQPMQPGQLLEARETPKVQVQHTGIQQVIRKLLLYFECNQSFTSFKRTGYYHVYSFLTCKWRLICMSCF